MHLDGWTIALQAINFAILVWLLHRFLYKPVLATVDARRAEVQRQYDDAKAADDKAKAELAAIAADRAGIAAERERTIKAAAEQAAEAAAARHAQAEQDAEAVLGEGRRVLSAERERALQEARNLALDLGAAFARRLLDEVPAQLRAEAWIERIEQHLSALPKSDLDALVRQLAGDGTLTVVTAGPLPPEAESLWRTRLGALLGTTGTILFEANPALIAGAELHFPTAVLRFSWQSVLAAIRSEVEAHADAH